MEIVVVTNGADAAGTDAAPRFPLKSLVQGPVRVVPKEMPSVSWRSVDLAGRARIGAGDRAHARRRGRRADH